MKNGSKNIGTDFNPGELRDALQQIAGTFNKDLAQVFVCNVDSVNEDDLTIDCTPTSGESDSPIPNIQLVAEPNLEGFILIPAVDSTVIIGVSIMNVPFVIMFSEIDKIMMIPNTSIQMFDGSYGGLVKIQDLITKLNNLENKVNDIINGFTAHTHTGGTIGGNTGPASASFLPDLPLTVKQDLENPLITHGTTPAP